MTDPKPRRRWHQFSLRTLLIVVLVLSLPSSWLGVKLHEARKQREAVGAILEAGGTVLYEYQFDESGKFVAQAEPPTPAWLRSLLGDDLFRDVAYVSPGRDSGDAELEQLKGLTSLRRLNLDGGEVTDAGLEHLKGLTSLEELDLSHTQVTDAGLKHLKGLASLEYLGLCCNKVSNEGVKKLQEALPNCQIIH